MLPRTPMNKTTIDDCPFCASSELGVDGSVGTFYVCCESCGAIGPDADSEIAAVELWNDRTP